MPGLYVHMPFCIQKCFYCDFVSYAGKLSQIKPYIRAISIEAAAISNEISCEFDTVFIGGGTPSLMQGEDTLELLNILRANFMLTKDAEITIECNPGTLDESKLKRYKLAGINRLSIGLQSASDVLLKKIGRIHDVRQFDECYKLARLYEFDNINIDLMARLPGQTISDYAETLKYVIGISPEHISAYMLIVEENTPIKNQIDNGDIVLPAEDEAFDMLDTGIAFLSEHGYRRYEISNFALEGHECKHNLNYWHNGQYFGLGAAAHSAWNIGNSGFSRWENTADIDEYIALPHLPISERKIIRIDKCEEMFEFVMLGLRLTDGFSEQEFSDRFRISIYDAYPAALKKLKSLGWLGELNGRICLTKNGLDMQNPALQFFLGEHNI